MANLDPSEAAAIAHGRWAGIPPSEPLSSFAIDTRRIKPGETFVALRSDRSDGHNFLRQAMDYRATAALVEHVNGEVPLPQLVVEDSLEALQSLAGTWRARFQAPVIGITGSNGKTTVKELLGKVMGSQWFRTKGNYNNHIGVPLSLLELDPRQHAGALLEAGVNEKGEMLKLARLIRPDHALITSVGPSHLEGLGDIQGVAREKSILAAMVRPGGTVWIPANLLNYAPFRQLPVTLNVNALLRDGERADPDWLKIPNVTIYHYKWTEDVRSRAMGALETQSPMLPGEFFFRAGSAGMVSNLALVVHMALQLGVPAKTIQACLDGWRPFQQRGETIQCGPTIYYVDCYNANPASMLDGVERFSHLFPEPEHVYVLGTMNELGPESAKWHQQTTAGLPLKAGSEIYLVGEQAEAMAAGLREQDIAGEHIHIEQDRQRLKEQLSGFKGAVFLKGSRTIGMESIVPEEGTPC